MCERGSEIVYHVDRGCNVKCDYDCRQFFISIPQIFYTIIFQRIQCRQHIEIAEEHEHVHHQYLQKQQRN